MLAGFQRLRPVPSQVRDSAGNLSGAHPSSHGDPSLHAWVCASSQARLAKAVALLLEVLQPTNGRLRKFGVEPGGSVVLEPDLPRWVRGAGWLLRTLTDWNLAQVLCPSSLRQPRAPHHTLAGLDTDRLPRIARKGSSRRMPCRPAPPRRPP